MKKIIILNQNGPLVDSFESGYKLGLVQWPNLTRAEYTSMFDNNFFESARLRGNEAASPEEIARYKSSVHQPEKLRLPVVAGMNKLLRNLSWNYTIIINSSGDEQSIREWLLKNDLDHYVSGVYAKSHGLLKADKFDSILEQYQARDSDALYITDKIGDAKEAIAKNINVILVTWGYQSKEHLLTIKDQVYATVDTPTELDAKVGEFFSNR